MWAGASEVDFSECVPPFTFRATSLPAPPGVVQVERKQVTVLVAGLKGITDLAQRVDAEVLYELLQRAATVMRQEVQGLEGYVTHCTGEHLIALFGAPVAQEDHVIRALHAALGIQRAFAADADALLNSRAMRLDLGLGIHTGTVVIGSLGAEPRADARYPRHTVSKRHFIRIRMWCMKA